MSIDLDSIGLEAVHKVLEKGSHVFNEETKEEDFNRACDYILDRSSNDFYNLAPPETL